MISQLTLYTGPFLLEFSLPLSFLRIIDPAQQGTGHSAWVSAPILHSYSFLDSVGLNVHLPQRDSVGLLNQSIN